MLALARQAGAPEGAVEDVTRVPHPPRAGSTLALRTRRRIRQALQHEQVRQARMAERYAQGWAQQRPAERTPKAPPNFWRRRPSRWDAAAAVLAFAVAALLIRGMLLAPRGEQGEPARQAVPTLGGPQ